MVAIIAEFCVYCKGDSLRAAHRYIATGGNLLYGGCMKQKEKSKKSTSWGGVAEWYDGVVEDSASYQSSVVLPNLMRMMNIQKGECVFDVACGQGFFSRAFLAAGAEVVGSDISPELILLAQKNSSREIEFYAAPAEQSEFIADASIDKIAIVLALQNIERVAPVMSMCARVLKPGGKMYIVVNHPTFRIPGKSDWGWDDAKRVQFRRIDEYMTEKKHVVQMHPGSDPSEVTFSFHRPLQLYVKHLARVGFAVSALEEWISNRKSNSGPRAAAENKARFEIPLFMCIEATKFSERL